MKKLLCLMVVACFSLLGCAPSDTGSPAPSDNTSQIEVPAVNHHVIEHA